MRAGGARARGAWLALLALDARLAGVVRSAREPLLGQMRLAWWRDRLNDAPGTTPRGEPLLAALAPWDAHRSALAALVDGWEVLLGEAPLSAEALADFAAGRAKACAGLADLLGADAVDAARLAKGWGLGDLAGHLSHPDELQAARDLAAAHDWTPARLPRAMRPLVVLHGFSRRRVQGRATGAGAFFTAMRLGFWGS